MFEHLYGIIPILDRCVQGLCNKAHFLLRFDSMKMKSSAKKKLRANAMVHITFIYRTMLVDVMSIVFVYQQNVFFKKNSNSIALY